ncbi:BAG family molecular chaperone regulator 6 isoform X2 [Helianthus annuus]|uniref:BAG family molecular chaperone regulator 6 isoform X2 n=1 Tax=Helianthus annuus TaxID=4232 RepID=UPI000B8FE546|nr:BAG family molecular chaperone regulator 6 isoform X2 [Helianthus annuus]
MYPAYMWTDPHHAHPSHMLPPYPLPQQHHGYGCCNHTPYYGGCPYSHYTHYPPYYPPHGVYSPFPAPYSLPPQHYYYSSVNHPSYNYHNNNNHPCSACNHKEDDKGPRVNEEEESQVDNKTSDSLVPLFLKDRPIMWVPPGYNESKESDKDNKYSHEPVLVKHLEPSKDHPDYPIMWVPSGYDKSKANDKDKYSNEPVSVKRLEPSKDLPDYPIMWVPRGYTESSANDKGRNSNDPVLVKHPEPSKWGGNGELAQDEQGGTGDGNRFPFKIFWLPSKNDQVGKDTKENNLDLVANKGLLDEKATKKGSGGEGECETSSKHAARKVFPVKQASTNEEASSKHAIQKVIPVKQASTNEEKKNPRSMNTNSDSVEKTDNGGKTSPKASKLPPVCLRIDPLPKKKKTSRSPSPGDKERSNGSPVNSPKSSQQQAQVLKKSKEEQSEGDIKTVDHANKVKQANLAEHADNVERANLADHVNKVEPANLADPANKVEQANLADLGDVPREKGEEKKNMSEHEAALIIQSVYHGFEVRKSQPLKKLRQIYEVRKMVADLTNRIQDMETCLDSKKAVIIGETIMSLLLKLDTIQGLHPFVREVRKSVAKELVGLQEKLDYLTSVKSETPSEGSMHPEDDGKLDQAQAQTGLCENREHNDDAEACKTTNVEQQLEKSTEGGSIQDRFDQAPTESDSVICENHGVEVTVSQEGCDTIGETHKEKIDRAPTESDEALGLCENHEVEASDTQQGCNIVGEPQLESHKGKIDQAPTECNEAENHEVEASESQGEGCNSVGERQLDEVQLESHKEKFDHAPTECDEAVGLCENHEVRVTESQEGCNTIGEEPSHEGKFDQAPTECQEAQEFHKENHEVEATVSQEGCNTSAELHNDQAPAECDRLHKEDHEVEATTIGESHKEKSDQAPSECDVESRDGGVECNDDMKVEEYTGEVNKKKKQVEREELVNVESMVEEENEKLRVAVEELMKAGNEQLEVIRELTGRVKELEKKLSNSKSKKLNKKSRRSRGCSGIQKDYYSLLV